MTCIECSRPLVRPAEPGRALMGIVIHTIGGPLCPGCGVWLKAAEEVQSRKGGR